MALAALGPPDYEGDEGCADGGAGALHDLVCGGAAPGLPVFSRGGADDVSGGISRRAGSLIGCCVRGLSAVWYAAGGCGLRGRRVCRVFFLSTFTAQVVYGRRIAWHRAAEE